MKTYGNHEKKNTTTMNIAVISQHPARMLIRLPTEDFDNRLHKFFANSLPWIALSVNTIIKAKPIHQTAGLPKTEMVETTLFGKYDISNHLGPFPPGLTMNGQVHQTEEKESVVVRLE